MNQTNNRIREEWIEKWRWDMSYQQESDLPKMIADWWLSKIDELLKSQRDDLMEKIEKMMIVDDGLYMNCEYNSALDDVLELLTNSSTLDGEQSEHLSPNKENKEYNNSSVKIDAPKPPFSGLHYQG